MHRHKAVTVAERAGHAARCDVERDGVTHICSITFGGFPSKSDARAALVQEKASVDRCTDRRGVMPKEGTEMYKATIAQTTDVHESLRHLVEGSEAFDIRNVHAARLAVLPEGDAHWIDQDEVRRAKTSAGFTVVRVYDLRTGKRLFEGGSAPDGWLAEQLGGWYDRLDWFARNFPNTYVVNGDYLFVSGGSWVITGMPDADGEVEFTSLASLKAEMMQEEQEVRAAWLDENAAAVAAVRPDWADPSITWLDMLTDDETPDSIEFYRVVGTVKIEQAADVTGGVIVLIGEPQIRVTGQDEAKFDIALAASVASDIAEAVRMLSASGGVS